MTTFVKTSSYRYVNMDRIERFYYVEDADKWWLTAEVVIVPNTSFSACCRDHVGPKQADAYYICTVSIEQKDTWSLGEILRDKGVLENF